MNTEEALSLRKKLIENNHSVKIEAAGYSMFPFMLPGDEQTISPVPIEDIAIGDVVVFEHDNKWISHRVISIQNNNNEKTLILRGDTCIQLDPLVTKANYIGKTVAFERNGKSINLDEQITRSKRIIQWGLMRCYFFFLLKTGMFLLSRIKRKLFR
jgi:signal peptidase I